MPGLADAEGLVSSIMGHADWHPSNSRDPASSDPYSKAPTELLEIELASHIRQQKVLQS
jgi:hypothetical protein